MNPRIKNARQTFSERITVPILMLFILHTIIISAAVFLGANTPIALAVGMVSAVLFGALLRQSINKSLSISIKRIIHTDPSNFKARAEDVESDEDIAMLYSHFSELISNFNTLQMDIGALADDHIKGIHSTTIDESKYKGATLELVRRVNMMAMGKRL